MRYRNITLNNKISLVKYEDKYKSYLEEVKKLDRELSSSIEECPKIYSELSEHQSYMIFLGERTLIGAVKIETSPDEKDLEILIQFIDKKVDENDIFTIIEQIVSSLKFYCYEKNNIKVQTLNNIDLEEFDSFNYKKECLFENVVIYTTSNEFNNLLFSKLFNEIKGAEENLINLNQNWSQVIYDYDLEDNHIVFDEENIKEYKNHTVPFKEIFYKAKSIWWEDINSRKSKREINFKRNGQISLTKNDKDHKNNYEFLYNVQSNGFNFVKENNDKKLGFEIEENRFFTRIKTENYSIYNGKEDNIRKLNYKSKIEKNSSIFLELYLNQQDEIEKCYVDFRTHKNGKKSKINGLYALRIFKEENSYKLELKFINRKGSKDDSFDFEYTLKDKFILEEKELYKTN